MVKVLENQLIDLDLFPGQKPADLLAKASEIEASSPEKAQALRALADKRAATLLQEIERKTGGAQNANVPEGQEQQNPGGVKGVGMGLVNTVGGLGKGVGDTLGNTVYSLGTGLGQTGVAVANGLTQAGSIAIGRGGSSKAVDEEILGVEDNKRLEEALAKARSIQDESNEAKTAEENEEQIAQTAAEEAEESAKRRPRKIELRSGESAEAAETTEATEAKKA